VKNGKINYSLSEEYVDYDEAKKLLLRGSLKIGDVLFTTEAPLGEVANIDRTDIALAQRIIKFSGIRTIIDNYYLKYWIYSNTFQSNLKTFATGSTVLGIKGSRIRLLNIILPTLKEQNKIANYIDIKSSAIDYKIELLTVKAYKYKALHRSLINETVCRGLNPNTTMKDSGIEWIGMMPEHWKMYRMKDIGFLFSGLSGKAGDDFNQDENENNRDFIPFTNIFNNDTINPNVMGTVVIFENEKQNKVKKDDLFFLMSSEDYDGLGKSSLLTVDLKETYLNSFCKGFRITKKFVLPAFLNYQLQSDTFRKILQIEGKGFTRLNLKIEKVTDLNVFIPDSIFEQNEIVSYINEKTTQIDTILTNISGQINKLTQLRKTLINDVVTGKIKVTD
jgi:type I restriction enzyme, S subunit